jgi:predicted RND superfamily exporter protein
LLRSTTAAAVFFSAVTTVVSFGSLAFSPHNGVASLGVVLVTGMLITLACNLVFLPALLAIRNRGR